MQCGQPSVLLPVEAFGEFPHRPGLRQIKVGNIDIFQFRNDVRESLCRLFDMGLVLFFRFTGFGQLFDALRANLQGVVDRLALPRPRHAL